MKQNDRLRSFEGECSLKIDVGGRTLAVTRGGTGTPTVVLECGLGAESAEWQAVQNALGALTTVVRYDRAGRGASEPAGAPRTALDMAVDLHAMLKRAGLPAPYILVGHSFGGLICRLFAHHHLDSVVGLVLVDSLHEQQFESFADAFPAPSPLEPAALSRVRAFWTGGWRDFNSTTERIDFASSIDQGRSIASLGDLAIHVITARMFLSDPSVPDDRRAFLQAKWDVLQSRLLKLSTQSSQSFVDASGHFVQRDAPEAIISAVVSQIDLARRRAMTS